MVYEVGARIKELREACNWSQKDLGDRISKSVATISSYELNRQVPPMDVMASLAAVFHVSVDFLAGMEQEKVYATAGLTPTEREIAELLFTEISASSGCGEGFSERRRKSSRNLHFILLAKTTKTHDCSKKVATWLYFYGIPEYTVTPVLALPFSVLWQVFTLLCVIR